MLLKRLIDKDMANNAVIRLERAVSLGPHTNYQEKYSVSKERVGPQQHGVEYVDGTNAYGVYGLFPDISDHIHERVEDAFDKELLPTYNYSRIYHKGDILHKHTDRPSCECSVTLNLGNLPTDQSWAMGVSPSVDNPEEIYYDMKVGDATAYYGCDMPHWRKPLTYDVCYQVFIHYVDANGPYAEWHAREQLSAFNQFNQ